jgi:NTP pyrophosphatase (non-canonical NTP hydrolase)
MKSMNSETYRKLALVTESVDLEAIIGRMSDKRFIRILHGTLGVATEGGELLDALKKYVFYGKELDVVNVAEEIGDVLWYLNLLLDELNIPLEKIMEQNIEKLTARYGEKFSAFRALNRDLEKEREVLEK